MNNPTHRKNNHHVHVAFYLNKIEIIAFVTEPYYPLISSNKVYYKTKK